MQPETTRPRPAGTGPRPYIAAPGNVRRQYTEAAVKTANRPRRCPWFADVQRLAAAPIGPYSGWRDTALIFAGRTAWERAEPIRNAGRRAVTVCPPGTDPKSIEWPKVQHWLGDAGDLPAGDVIALARALIEAGATRVTLVAASIPEGALIAKRRPA